MINIIINNKNKINQFLKRLIFFYSNIEIDIYYTFISVYCF